MPSTSLYSLTEQLQVAMRTFEEDDPTLSPEARASGLERTLGIPKGGEGVPSGRAKKQGKPEAKESITALLDRSAQYLHAARSGR